MERFSANDYIESTRLGARPGWMRRRQLEFGHMGSFSIWHWLIVLVIAALVFGGRGKLSGIMGDAAKGIRAFKDGLKDEDPAAAPAKPLTSVEREKDEVRG
jgi:sec-independent protein translocase protein TatA